MSKGMTHSPLSSFLRGGGNPTAGGFPKNFLVVSSINSRFGAVALKGCCRNKKHASTAAMVMDEKRAGLIVFIEAMLLRRCMDDVGSMMTNELASPSSTEMSRSVCTTPPSLPVIGRKKELSAK